MRRLFAFSLLVACAGCSAGDAPEGGPKLPFRPSAGARVPAYTAPDLHGATVSLAELRGKVVLINVWATWCEPCRAELPALEDLHQRYGTRGLAVVGISIDQSSREEVGRFLGSHGVHYANLYDPAARIRNQLGWPGALPWSMLVDRNGRVVRWWFGPIPQDDHEAVLRFRRSVEAML